MTQNMIGRPEFCGLQFWLDATKGLPAKPAGPGSERLPGGIGALGYDEMRQYLRSIRAYLYTGTQPASYTLGLIEAMMTGVPVVSIDASKMWTPELFEAQEIRRFVLNGAFSKRKSVKLTSSRCERAQFTRNLSRTFLHYESS